MEIPKNLWIALENLTHNKDKTTLTNDARQISFRYRTKNGTGERLLTKDNEAAAYAAARMPATYCAVLSALKHSLSDYNGHIETQLDVGAGTGAASWAADTILNLKSITCLEREQAMINTGKLLIDNGSNALKNIQWISHNLTDEKLPIRDQADLVIASYVLNEINDVSKEAFLYKLWNCTSKLLLIIEPGTPLGFENINKTRTFLLKNNANVIAPCTHNKQCPKAHTDWCNFSCRVPRSIVHRKLKGGDAPYEDEKYSYVAFVRESYKKDGMRVMRHPKIYSGFATFEVCTCDGIENIKLSKKDGERYKKVRKANAGDLIL